jgi:hypothetical protein
MARKAKPATAKTVEALRHEEATRRNIPTAEYQSVLEKAAQDPVRVAYERRNRDLDPQLVWRGKDEQDWSDLVVHAPPLYIQEKVHPKALIDDLLRQTWEGRYEAGGVTADLFADFNGLPQGADKTDFYQHDQNWSNRMLLGDSLQVMASLAEREGLRGKVQCIYIDPPYGIKFNSNFQWSTTSRDVKDGNAAHITREPEQVKAFRDTWRDGIHSYLTYLRDRLTVARDLLTESGSIFVQIGDENVHRVRALMDEVFGDANFSSIVTFQSTTSLETIGLSAAGDYLIWYYKDATRAKYRPLMRAKAERGGFEYYAYLRTEDGQMWRGSKEELELVSAEHQVFFPDNITSQRPLGEGDLREFKWVESLSPHRVLGVDDNDELIDQFSDSGAEYAARQTFPQMILENLRTAGVQQAHKDARIAFTALTPWPGDLVAAEGRYMEGEGAAAVERRAAIFIGPEFGTVTRPDLVVAAREAGDAGFDVLIACAFNYEAHATEFSKLGRIPVLKARMNADLHMAEDLKNTGKGNLFVIFGEPDITLLPAEGGRMRVKVNGVDVFHPSTGEVRSERPRRDRLLVRQATVRPHRREGDQPPRR